jgi:hypothetical protein
MTKLHELGAVSTFGDLRRYSNYNDRQVVRAFLVSVNLEFLRALLLVNQISGHSFSLFSALLAASDDLEIRSDKLSKL